jgi:hypothetical protein
LYFVLRKNHAPAPIPIPNPSITPQQECINKGYIWDPQTSVCISINCIASVDADSGIITGSVVDVSGTSCIEIVKDIFISPYVRAHLIDLCQQQGFFNYIPSSTGLQCTKASGCNTQKYNIDNSLLQNCVYMTLQPGTGNKCVAPNTDQIEHLCNTSVEGCPVNTSLNSSCSATSNPCYDPVQGNCLPASDTPGCRPSGKNWEWIDGTCIDATVSKSITVTITKATLDEIDGNYTIPEPPANTSLIWNFTLTDDSKNPPNQWQGPFTPSYTDNSFSILINNLSTLSTPTEVGIPYNFTVQVSISYGIDLPYVPAFTSLQPTQITLQSVPVAPNSLLTIQPTLDYSLASKLVNDVNTAVDGANNVEVTHLQNMFQKPDTNIWTNSLPILQDQQNLYIIVPCTTAYCLRNLNDMYAMLIFAWKPITSLSPAQISDISTCSPAVTNPQVSYAVYSDDLIIGNRLRGGSWFQPILSKPGISTRIKLVAYVWSHDDQGDQGIENSKCTAQPNTFDVVTPPTLYSAKTCFYIKPLIETQGAPIPGNFMLYEPRDNMCSQPVTTLDALSARDFSCMTSTLLDPTITSMKLYGCNDHDESVACASSGQTCEYIVANDDVRQPDSGQDTNCSPLDPNSPIPCGGSQYCQNAACNCPTSVPWSYCGQGSYADVGQNTNKAIIKDRWVKRLQNIKVMIDTYNLTSFLINGISVQTFSDAMGTSNTPVLETLWDQTYGLNICPLANNTDWVAPTPQNCDVTSTSNCQQENVCGAWEEDPNQKGLYIQQVYVYPSADLTPSCCDTNYKYFARCCCDDSQSYNTCKELKPVCKSAITNSTPTWCNPNFNS